MSRPDESQARRHDPFSIGEFSRITGLTVKTLRFYHERGVLVPTSIDEETGYRYYGEEKIEIAAVVSQLRQWEVPLAEIKQILDDRDDEADLFGYLERHLRRIDEKAKEYQRIRDSLAQLIDHERKARATMQAEDFAVEEKTVDDLWIAGVRMRGKYSDCGQGFAKLGRRFGRKICGQAMLLHFDAEYKEDDADFEACFPVRDGRASDGNATDGISVRQLEGGPCVTLLHRGPYDTLGRSYEKIFDYVKHKGYVVKTPSREVYVKGPGMIFRGNPKKYLTEIQLFYD